MQPLSHFCSVVYDVPLPPHVSPSPFFLELHVHFLSQETELFEIIAKLQVSFSGIDLVCASSRRLSPLMLLSIRAAGSMSKDVNSHYR